MLKEKKWGKICVRGLSLFGINVDYSTRKEAFSGNNELTKKKHFFFKRSE